MTEHLLEIRFASSGNDNEERIRGLLFLAGSSGDFISGEESTCCITAFFENPRSRAEARTALSKIEGLRLEDVDRDETDWLLNYQQSLQAFEVGARFVIAPEERLIDPGSRIALIIPQEHAFGTGSHESTALCLEMLEQAAVEGSDCLDIGTGSGILAIAMAALGARRVFAFDNDVETFGVLEANVRRNRVAPGRILQFFGGPESIRFERFGVTTMNILPEVIVELMPVVALLIAPAGRIIFSGVIREKSEQVIDAARAAGLVLVDESSSGEWWCGMFIRAGFGTNSPRMKPAATT